MKTLIVFPVHCFSNHIYKKIIKKHNINEIIIWKHRVYWGDRRPQYKKRMKFNKLKIELHERSLKDLVGRLRGLKIDVKETTEVKGGNKEYIAWDPVDHLVEDDLRRINCMIVDSPLFLCKRDDLENYKMNNGKYMHVNFYRWQLDRLGIDEIDRSYDTENRGSIPRDVKIPDNMLKGDFRYPTTPKEALKVFRDFLRMKLFKFGEYQDSISYNMTPNNDILFHSGISSSLNIGLITPEGIVKMARDYYKRNKRRINIADYEGFLRQIIGWREYERMIYWDKELCERMRKSNYFGFTKKLNDKWYNGGVGVLPVDMSIKSGWETGYLHHILRLMVMGNFMTLCEIDPDEVYRWFMEFSVDSYDWVMVGNVYGMATYASGRLTMRKPYLSSSNYILQMGNFNKEEQKINNWTELWTALYYVFIKNNETKLKGTPYIRNLSHWRKFSKEKKERYERIVKEFLSGL